MNDEHFNPLGDYTVRDELRWEIGLLLEEMNGVGSVQRRKLDAMTTAELQAHYNVVCAAFNHWLLSRVRDRISSRSRATSTAWNPDSYVSPFSGDDIINRAG